MLKNFKGHVMKIENSANIFIAINKLASTQLKLKLRIGIHDGKSK
jgi:hypothetical protein